MGCEDPIPTHKLGVTVGSSYQYLWDVNVHRRCVIHSKLLHLSCISPPQLPFLQPHLLLFVFLLLLRKIFQIMPFVHILYQVATFASDFYLSCCYCMHTFSLALASSVFLFFSATSSFFLWIFFLSSSSSFLLLVLLLPLIQNEGM
jgi:hypothetical protein